MRTGTVRTTLIFRRKISDQLLEKSFTSNTCTSNLYSFLCSENNIIWSFRILSGVWKAFLTKESRWIYSYGVLMLTDTDENVQKWTRVVSTRRWVILVARSCLKREEKNVSTFGRFRLWTSFESSPVSVKVFRYKPTIDQHKLVSKSVSQIIITSNYIVRIYLLGIWGIWYDD